MASTYTTSLKIQKMGNGEDSGTWGSITNINWDLIEQAVSGVQSITMTNANYTLTNLNGVSDEARNMVLVVGGTNSAIYQVIAPLAPKFYVVTNNTIGGYAITIGGATGSIITVPSNTTVQVYCDGTNFFSAQTSSAGNFNVNGNLNVVGTTVLGSSLTGTTGTFSGAISAVSPTFTGVPVAPTAPAGTNTTQIATTAFVLTNGVPSGCILLWSGSIASIPSGFYLCNGANGTPDLRDRFVVGAGSTYSVAATGGSADATLVSHSHSATSSVSDPGHSHAIGYGEAGGMQGPWQVLNYNNAYKGTTGATTGITVSTSISTAGSSATNANLPPYYALAYIMKA